MNPWRWLGLAVLISVAAHGAPPPVATAGDRQMTRYFAAETAAIETNSFSQIHSLADWTSRREGYRQELLEMLGLSPLPARTDLKPVVTGTLERDDFVVEKLHFQSMPGLYVTGNLYRPKSVTRPLPTILYVCGHSHVIINGVSYGNKTDYQHHAIWFARNGYVCLVIDSLDLGEIQGEHHGTYNRGRWWWNSRGYTPAGVEAWNSMRALDYLSTRPEVDATRFGVTGRSGGGAYSWWISALDDRIKAACPVAGITDLHNHVVDGTVEGHCDCMFMVNTRRWDYAQVAALVAPRPLLICNSDKDGIFPLEGVARLHEKVRSIYRLYGASTNLGLLITEGPHKDTQDLQVPVFRWFNRFLKGDESIVDQAARKMFTPAELKVFDRIPDDQINTRIDEVFVPQAAPGAGSKKEVTALIREKVFGGWPAEGSPVQARKFLSHEQDGVLYSAYDFESQPEVGLRVFVLQSAKGRPKKISFEVFDGTAWSNWVARLDPRLRSDFNFPDSLSGQVGAPPPVLAEGEMLVKFAPRGTGLTALRDDLKYQTQARRRFMLLGQTLDGMRVWDVRRAVQAIRSVPEFRDLPIQMSGTGEAVPVAALASMFETEIHLQKSDWPSDPARWPDFLNLFRIVNPSDLAR